MSTEREAIEKLTKSLELTANRYELNMAQELERKTKAGVMIADLLRDALADSNAPRRPMDLKKSDDGAVRAIVGEYGAHLAKRSEITPQIKRDIEVLFYVGPKLGMLASLDFHNFYFEGADGDFLFETPNDWPLKAPPDENYKAYFELVSPLQNPSRKPAWKPVYYDEIQKLWMTSLRVPVYDGDRFLGAVGFDYVLDSVLEDVKSMYHVEGWCKAFLFNATGDLIVHPEYMDKIQAASTNNAQLATKSVANAGVSAFINLILSQKRSTLDDAQFFDGDELTYASVRTINSLGWKLVLYTPRNFVTGPLRSTQLKVVSTSAVLAILLALLIRFGFRHIVLDRLATLASSARQLGAGHWNAALPPVQDDEIGSLTISFKDMAEKLRVLVLELEDRVEKRTAELAKAKESAESTSEKLDLLNKDLRAFSYSVSHDLRAPLRGIDGWSLALEEDCGAQLNEQGREYLGRVRSEAQRMGELIDDLLILSRVTQSEMKKGMVDVSEMSQRIISRLRETHPERNVESLIQPGLLVHGDAGLLQAAMTNLLDNAWKFTGKRASARIELGRMEKNGTSCFFVRDNGAGFDMAFASKLFAPFQRMHKPSEFPGTGIGLATVQCIILRHGGRIWVESHVDQGTTFFFTLPPVNSAEV